MPWNTPLQVRDWILSMMDEPSGTASDFVSEVDDAIDLAKADFDSRHPWYWNLGTRPGVFVTTDDITTLTITVSSTGTSIAGTLSAAPSGSVSILNRKIRPGGSRTWIARVTAHTGGETGVTLDAIPATLAAGTTTTIFQDEYALASDFGYFDHGLWTQDGRFIEVWDLERLIGEYPDPPSSGWPPRAAAISADQRIRFSTYPTSIQRVEYYYVIREAALTAGGTTTLTTPAHLRWIIAQGALYYALLFKSDKRAQIHKQEFERGIQLAVAFDRRVRTGQGRVPASPTYSVYG